MTDLRNGPCAAWVDGPAVKDQVWVQAAAAKAEQAGLDVDALCAQSAVAASEILYELSGRVFTGACGPVTVRPLARPTDIDSRAWATQLAGWDGSWGACQSYGAPTGVASHFGCSNPPEIELGAYPVTEIVQVLIDGVVIPADEYELRNNRTLVRLRPTAASTPTAQWGWPTCQINDLPDTEPGTFSVTYDYGQPPPQSGILAAGKLAEYLVLPQLGDNTRYPARVTNVTRQGVTASVADVMDTVKDGGTGIWEVEVFLNAVNPHRATRQAAVWSPELGRPRRTNPS